MLVLFPDNPDKKFREVLVLVRPNELKEKWDGRRLRKEEATAISGIEPLSGSTAWMPCCSPGYTWRIPST